MNFINSKVLREMAFFYTNTDRQDLEESGLIKVGKSGDARWKRWNHNFDIFILKLNPDELDILSDMMDEYIWDRLK